jgi:hypothetical protein
MKRLVLISFLLVSMAACKKDEKDPDPTPAPAATSNKLTIEFTPHVGDSNLVFGTKWYKNFNNDSFKVTLLRYYISNVVLTKSDNSTYTVPGSYYKIDHGIAGKNKFTMTGIPVSGYKAIQFMIGIDSTANCSGAQDGELAVSDMFWSWNTGYIFAKMEGSSPKSPASAHFLEFHIGGYKTPNVAMRTVSLPFGSPAAELNVTASNDPALWIDVDLAKWFNGPGAIVDFSTMYSVSSPGANAKKIADNYAQSFKYVGFIN